MTPKFLAAVIQMDSGSDKSANVEQAADMIAQAAAEGARLVVLPELFSYLGNLAALRENADTMDGPTLQRMRALAIEYRLVLCAGSLAIVISEDPHKVLNRSVVYGPQGQILSIYDKIHCFDINLPDVRVMESNYITSGRHLGVASTPLGHLGQAICYDLRFPEIFRRLTVEGMQICVLPSAFTDKTGQAHWEVLTRARAIENQVYFLAPNQCGMYGDSVRCYGKSLMIDPWGTVLARAEGDRPSILYAEIDLANQRKIRNELPALTHRRLV